MSAVPKRPDGWMREHMPECSAFIDDLRATFGAAAIDGAIRAGLRDGTFTAMEAGHQVGAPFCPWPPGVKVGDMVLGPPQVVRPKERR